LRKAELKDCVRNCEPVPCEVFVDDLVGLDSVMRTTAASHPRTATRTERVAWSSPRRALAARAPGPAAEPSRVWFSRSASSKWRPVTRLEPGTSLEL